MFEVTLWQFPELQFRLRRKVQDQLVTIFETIGIVEAEVRVQINVSTQNMGAWEHWNSVWVHFAGAHYSDLSTQLDDTLRPSGKARTLLQNHREVPVVLLGKHGFKHMDPWLPPCLSHDKRSQRSDQTMSHLDSWAVQYPSSRSLQVETLKLLTIHYGSAPVKNLGFSNVTCKDSSLQSYIPAHQHQLCRLLIIKVD